MPFDKLKKFAQIVDTSAKDASRARKVSRSPKAQQIISADRRTGLSQFETVRQALADRAKIAKQKAAKQKAAKKKKTR